MQRARPAGVLVLHFSDYKEHWVGASTVVFVFIVYSDIPSLASGFSW
jgi:hypothetical protein